jgi:hypothetical protein
MGDAATGYKGLLEIEREWQISNVSNPGRKSGGPPPSFRPVNFKTQKYILSVQRGLEGTGKKSCVECSGRGKIGVFE